MFLAFALSFAAFGALPVAAQHTLDEVAKHDSSDDCWSALYGRVYGLTEYAPEHKFGGGPKQVYRLCGIDGTSLYDSVHGDNKQWLQTISSIQDLGPLVVSIEPPTSAPTSRPTSDPTSSPTSEPTSSPTSEPTVAPTVGPTDEPTSSPTTETSEPTGITPRPTTSPTSSPTGAPTETSAPSDPSDSPTSSPTDEQSTSSPTGPPSDSPSANPTLEPTVDSSSANPTSEPTFSIEPTPTPVDMITTEQLALHNSPDDCWVAYYDTVYDLTTYSHPDPPGNVVIYNSCGKDGTAAYASVHERYYLDFVSDLIVGPLDTTEPEDEAPTKAPTEFTGVISLEELALHASADDCWVAYYDGVYDLTLYSHPGPGNSVIYMSCGADGTRDYVKAHPKDLLRQVEEFKVGRMESASIVSGGATFVALASSLLSYYLIFVC